jgi:hypothetical protein
VTESVVLPPVWGFLMLQISDETSPSLDQQIATLHQEIVKQTATIAGLAVDGHEVTDARAHLEHLLEQLEAMLRLKMETK